MTGLQFVTVLLSLGIGVAALAQASSLMASARVEIRGRVRDQALSRARRLTTLALASSTAVALVVGYVHWPSGAAPVALAYGGAATLGRDLQLSQELTLVRLPAASAETAARRELTARR